MAPAARQTRLIAAFFALSLAGTGVRAADRGVMQPDPGFRDALTSPLEDLNLKKTDIPDILVRAGARPYALDGLDRCEAVAGEIGRLDALLGPDLDQPPPPGPATSGAKAHGVAVDVAEDRAHSLLPFRGWVRRLTGAEHGARAVQAAIRAGEVRRGYLKGVGMRMNCAPPAAPSWFKPKMVTIRRTTRVTTTTPAAPAPWLQWWRGLGH